MAIRLLLTLLAAAILALPGCGGDGDATFSTSGFDAIEVGDSADSVTGAIGEPVATEAMELSHGGSDGAVWIYCDGAMPHYLILTDDAVAEDDLQLPDELRLSDENCS